MRRRVQDIILVSSLYDYYIFEEEGRLYELIRKEYQELNLSRSPELIHISRGKDAVALAKKEKRYNLIITTLHNEDMSAIELAKKIKEERIDLPIILLGYDNQEMVDLLTKQDIKLFENVFIWQGDFRIVIGIIKQLEDKLNVEYDSTNFGVQSIILIEDNVKFYSSYLPLIYTELVKQSQSLLGEGVNISHKLLRMRARPKILLCTNYEDAWEYFKKYGDNISGVISDINFLHKGKRNPKAGIKFARAVKESQPDIPILLQSNEDENKNDAKEVGASFILKHSPTLLIELREFMLNNFGFGDFNFKTTDGIFVGKASTLAELEQMLKKVPEESIVYHASRNHFSNWLKARTEFWLAYKLRPQKVTDFETIEDLRQMLINSISEYRKARTRGIIADFDRATFNKDIFFARLGGGSIGGKARGLGFINSLLSNIEIKEYFNNVDIQVPASIVIGTDVFDQFLDSNNLREFALNSKEDKDILQKFVRAEYFPTNIINELISFLEIMKEPLAVRSSSLLEDSQGQPFAGVYDTFMIPNNHQKIQVRLSQLINMIKRVYASTFYQRAKEYIKVTSYRSEEEKMGVIVQKMVGAKHKFRFYPDFSGLAKSFNFYPSGPLKSDDGLATIALGLGKLIMDGGDSVRFCPKYPQHSLQFATVEDTLKYSQKGFYALNLEGEEDKQHLNEEMYIHLYNVSDAESDGTLNLIGSTYSHENNMIYNGISRPGLKLVTFASVLKTKIFPLPEILDFILNIGSKGMGLPVELEFAVNLSVPPGAKKEFSVLQLRPLVVSTEQEQLKITVKDKIKILCQSDQVLGHGVVDDIQDIVYVDIHKFDRAKSKIVADEISKFNSKIVEEGKKYLLIGVGRWGTRDPWLGIPVTWEGITGAKAIIESNFKDFNVTLSQGSHFFQNLTSFKVSYFTVNQFLEQGFIDWDWLEKIQPLEEKEYTKHLRLDKPLLIKINGRENKGIILKS
ncbi:MAG: histidine kinase [Ignavibacteriales bacterium]|nr:histidine kinase [Ignavibacteriales bacterium]